MNLVNTFLEGNWNIFPMQSDYSTVKTQMNWMIKDALRIILVNGFPRLWRL
jgi:hypothetical protein